MAQRFDRDITLTIGDRVIRSRTPPTLRRDENGDLVQEPGQSREILRVVFKVEATNKPEPNQATVSVYNLARSNRQQIQEGGAEVILEAGYTGETSEIFRGDLSFGSNIRNGTDWVTTVETADGGKQVRKATISTKIPKGETVLNSALRIVESMGLGVGNLKQRLGKGDQRGGFQSFATTRVLEGKAYGELRQLLRSAGYEVSIQKGEIQVLAPGEANDSAIAIVDQTTGLIGSPERGDKGIVKFSTLLRPDITPGQTVRLTSQQLSGDYVCQKITHDGDTHGTKWYSEIEGKRL